MCMPKPGPRCSNHAKINVTKAEANLKDATAETQRLGREAIDLHEVALASKDDEASIASSAKHFEYENAQNNQTAAYAKLAQAKAEYDTTPDGIKQLRADGKDLQADIAAQRRQAQINQYNAANPGPKEKAIADAHATITQAKLNAASIASVADDMKARREGRAAAAVQTPAPTSIAAPEPAYQQFVGKKVPTRVEALQRAKAALRSHSEGLENLLSDRQKGAISGEEAKAQEEALQRDFDAAVPAPSYVVAQMLESRTIPEDRISEEQLQDIVAIANYGAQGAKERAEVDEEYVYTKWEETYRD